mmetsp:Transcript_941/g.1316  ORF Transcript_941/g.1316 Transcript_941/m.1316 type:complete len:241 (-) Transcript_941:19-741(-)
MVCTPTSVRRWVGGSSRPRWVMGSNSQSHPNRLPGYSILNTTSKPPMFSLLQTPLTTSSVPRSQADICLSHRSALPKLQDCLQEVCIHQSLRIRLGSRGGKVGGGRWRGAGRRRGGEIGPKSLCVRSARRTSIVPASSPGICEFTQMSDLSSVSFATLVSSNAATLRPISKAHIATTKNPSLLLRDQIPPPRRPLLYPRRTLSRRYLGSSRVRLEFLNIRRHRQLARWFRALSPSLPFPR